MSLAVQNMKFNWFIYLLTMLYCLLTQLFISIPITLAITRSTTFLIRVTTSIAVALTVMFPALPNYTCWNLQSLVALAVLLDPCVEEFFRTSAVCFTKQAQVWKHVHELFTLFRAQSVSLLWMNEIKCDDDNNSVDSDAAYPSDSTQEGLPFYDY